MIRSNANDRVNMALSVGFTLIELLVVISILALLIATLVPALGSAKRRAQAVKCLAHMRQMGTAWCGYSVDNKSFFPQNGMEGTYWSTPFGQPYLYSGCQAWMTYGTPPGAFRFNGNATPSQYSGMGMVWSYAPAPTTYFCPGNPRSEYWYKHFWLGEIPAGGTDAYWGFGQQGRGALMTYFYRSSMYYAEKSPHDVVSISFAYSANTVKKLDDVANKTMLTDFWDSYIVDGDHLTVNPETLPHGEGLTNIMATDGHAKTWRLPDDILPVWNFWDAMYTAGGFDNYAWTGQLPWWWVEADKAIRR